MTTTPGPASTDSPAKLVALVGVLTAVIALMLFAFAAPMLNSGAHDLPLAVTGPPAATNQIGAALAQKSPGAFAITTYDTAEAAAQAITARDAIGGIAVGTDGVTIQTAAGSGTPYKALLTNLGTGLAASGQKVTYAELAPTTADDPTGAATGSLGLPLAFGGMAGAVALTAAYRGSTRGRILGAAGLAILGGSIATGLLQYGFGAFDGNFRGIAAAVAAGIAAIAFTILGLESLIGYAGLGLGAVVMMFIANPLSGLATGADWLPQPWGAIGQFLPIGAAGTAIRSAAFFGGAGAAQAWLVLGAWILAGLALAAWGARRSAHTAGSGMPGRHAADAADRSEPAAVTSAG